MSVLLPIDRRLLSGVRPAFVAFALILPLLTAPPAEASDGSSAPQVMLDSGSAPANGPIVGIGQPAGDDGALASGLSFIQSHDAGGQIALQQSTAERPPATNTSFVAPLAQPFDGALLTGGVKTRDRQDYPRVGSATRAELDLSYRF